MRESTKMLHGNISVHWKWLNHMRDWFRMFKLFVICSKTLSEVVSKKKTEWFIRIRMHDKSFVVLLKSLLCFYFTRWEWWISIKRCWSITKEFMGLFRWRIVRCAWQKNWQNRYFTPTDISQVSLALSIDTRHNTKLQFKMTIESLTATIHTFLHTP